MLISVKVAVLRQNNPITFLHLDLGREGREGLKSMACVLEKRLGNITGDEVTTPSRHNP